MEPDHAPGVRQSSEGWFVVWTESRAEKRVEARMAAKGLQAWLPTVTELRRWSDRWQRVVMPLFPSYLFVRGEACQLSTVLQTPGVLTVVKTGARPALLEEGFIRALRRAVESPDTEPAAVDETPPFEQNDEVLVREGPLVGLRGIVREIRGARRLVVWIGSVGRGVAFTLDGASVRRACSGQCSTVDSCRC